MKIIIISDTNSSKKGGRESFFRNMYAKNPNQDFIEIQIADEIEDKYETPNNVNSYLTQKEELPILIKNIISSKDIVYINHVAWDSSSYDIYRKIKKIFKNNKFIFQQHRQYEKYKKVKFDFVDCISVYTKRDRKEWEKSGVKTFIVNHLGSDSYPGSNGDKGFVYSGREINDTFKKIIKLKSKTKLNFSVNVPTISKKWKNIFEKNGIHIYLGKMNINNFSYNLNLDKKGYSLAAIEALSMGISTIFLYECASYPELVSNRKLINKNMKALYKNIKEYPIKYSGLGNRTLFKDKFENASKNLVDKIKEIYQ